MEINIADCDLSTEEIVQIIEENEFEENEKMEILCWLFKIRPGRKQTDRMTLLSQVVNLVQSAQIKML